MSLARTLGQAIRDIRQAKRWSARELGERAGLDQTTIYRAENGITKPQTETLLAIFTAFGSGTLARWQENPESFKRLASGLTWTNDDETPPTWILWAEEPRDEHLEAARS